MRAIFLLLVCAALGWSGVDASRWGVKAASGSVAGTVLVEEVQKRSGVKLGNGNEIELVVNASEPGIGPEGYALAVDEKRARIAGRTERGLLYGVGALLRAMEWGPEKLELPRMDRRSSPESMLRGHQLGYRATANSWDAWTVAQFDQYIRELVLFGANAVENIPFQDTKAAPLMKVSRKEMHRAMSRICRKYDIEYWVWTPADFELSDGEKRAAFLKEFAEMAAEAERLDGVFVPGGDPGHNAPELVMPFLEDLAKRTKAKIWLSLQGFNREREDYAYRWIAEKRPRWLGGLVAGPSSPPALRSRAALPAEYGLRLYPDLTHNKICQYQVPGLDQAIALTLGREAINPRAAEMVKIHNQAVGTSVGFLSYSDGVHDDVNKTVFSALGWDSRRQAREILVEYARLYFSSRMATEIADGILALERNWRGPLVENGNVEATLREWDRLSALLPELAGNWRWQMNQLRAVYDAHSRRRLMEERELERAANAVLLNDALASGVRVERALEVLQQASGQKELRARIVELCEKLYQSIGLQTSVEKYGASGAERGAVLDFIDTPLNNKWWLEDELAKVRKLGDEALRLARLREIATWESPGPGSFYDDVGNEGRSPHTEMDERDEPLFWWLDQGRSRLRLSAQTTMWPKRLLYEGVKAGAKYVVRTGGQGQSLLKVDGERVGGKQVGEFWEFEVPVKALEDGRLELSWDVPTDEGHLNWRQRSRLAEVWLLKK
jgi:hypothetical protein